MSRTSQLEKSCDDFTKKNIFLKAYFIHTKFRRNWRPNLTNLSFTHGINSMVSKKAQTFYKIYY